MRPQIFDRFKCRLRGEIRGNMKICIVEDEAVWRDKIQAIIEKYCIDKNISFKIIYKFFSYYIPIIQKKQVKKG